MSLIDQLIQGGYLKTPEIIFAFKKIKREDFIPDNLKYQAEGNYPLSIGYGQTISQPLTVAFMLEKLQPQVGDKILDIGSGSGWTTTLLAEIVGKEGKVFAIERVPELKDFGEQNTKKYNFVSSGRVVFLDGDGRLGLEAEAPFAAILVSAAAREVPPALIKQLKVGGRLVIPVGGYGSQEIQLITKKENNGVEIEQFPGFVFVPLV